MNSSIKMGGGTSIRGIAPEMAIAHVIVSEVFSEFDANCVITSGTDGKHMNGSSHYTGRGLDYRIWTLKGDGMSDNLYRETVGKVCQVIAERLGSEFDVINEFDNLHIHVEFDPKRPLNEQV